MGTAKYLKVPGRSWKWKWHEVEARPAALSRAHSFLIGHISSNPPTMDLDQRKEVGAFQTAGEDPIWMVLITRGQHVSSKQLIHSVSGPQKGPAVLGAS